MKIRTLGQSASFRPHVLRTITTVCGKLTALVLLAFVVSCSRDLATGPNGDIVSICHVAGASGTVMNIFASELPEHRSHGDYVSTLFVDRQSGALGDGIHFVRIGDALTAARAVRVARNEMAAASCRITIAVAAGIIPGSVPLSSDPTFERFPLRIDFPGVTLRGALNMQMDASARALRYDASSGTTLSPVIGLAFETGSASEPLIIVDGHPDGFQGNDVTIEGFVLQSGHVGRDTLAGGQGVFALRVQNLIIRQNAFEGQFTESIDLRATSAMVDGNFLGGGGGTCDMCLAGPGAYHALNNMLLAGGIPGILISPAALFAVPPGVEQWALPVSAQVTATVENNEVRNHLRKPVGVGIRMAGIGANVPNVAGSIKATLTSNTLVNNNFGIIVEAGFPVANTLLKGDIDVTLTDNDISGSCQNAMLVSFSRHTTGLGLANAAYIHNSTYTIDLGYDIYWDKVWFADPAGFGNTLTVNGQLVPNGSRVAYDAAKTCAPM